MHPPTAIQIRGGAGRISRANSVREYAATIVNTGSCLAVRVCPNPTGTTMSGNQKSFCAISPAT